MNTISLTLLFQCSEDEERYFSDSFGDQINVQEQRELLLWWRINKRDVSYDIRAEAHHYDTELKLWSWEHLSDEVYQQQAISIKEAYNQWIRRWSSLKRMCEWSRAEAHALNDRTCSVEAPKCEIAFRMEEGSGMIRDARENIHLRRDIIRRFA